MSTSTCRVFYISTINYHAIALHDIIYHDMALRDRFPSVCKCYSQRLRETYNFMLVRSEAREAEVLEEEQENTPRQFKLF